MMMLIGLKLSLVGLNLGNKCMTSYYLLFSSFFSERYANAFLRNSGDGSILPSCGVSGSCEFGTGVLVSSNFSAMSIQSCPIYGGRSKEE